MAVYKLKPPWERSDPKDASGREPRHLTAREKAEARHNAEAHGRPYPNLVDNVREVRKVRADERHDEQSATHHRAHSTSAQQRHAHRG